ncbi:MAG: OadG family transporter subunit [Lachnospiraceae bacterium]
MNKKISLIIVILVFALSFTGCENKENIKNTYDSSSLEQISEIIIGSFTQMNQKDFQHFMDGSELEINLTLMQTGLPVEQTSFVSMMKAWKAATKECGTYVENDGYKIQKTNQEIILKTNAVFKKRDAVITFIFDNQQNIKSLTIDPKYSTEEILKKAGMNTVIGMGTVFAVLIFISIIISLFKFIPDIEAKFHNKSNSKPIVEDIPSANIQEVPEMELELIAVITAAIAAESKTSQDKIVIRSIKRRPSNKWK